MIQKHLQFDLERVQQAKHLRYIFEHQDDLTIEKFSSLVIYQLFLLLYFEDRTLEKKEDKRNLDRHFKIISDRAKTEVFNFEVNQERMPHVWKTIAEVENNRSIIEMFEQEDGSIQVRTHSEVGNITAQYECNVSASKITIVSAQESMPDVNVTL